MPSSLFTFDFSVAVELYWSIRVTTGSRERKPKFLWCYHSAQVALTAARARVKKGRTAEQIIQKIREAEVLVPGGRSDPKGSCSSTGVAPRARMQSGVLLFGDRLVEVEKEPTECRQGGQGLQLVGAGFGTVDRHGVEGAFLETSALTLVELDECR